MPPAPPAGAASVAACGRLLATLPERLDPGVNRRQVSEPARSAAWGDPAVVLTCGVRQPPSVVDPVQIGPPEGREFVTFVVRDTGDGQLWTTVDRRVPVSISVPDAYEGQLIAPMTGPLLTALPAR